MSVFVCVWVYVCVCVCACVFVCVLFFEYFPNCMTLTCEAFLLNAGEIHPPSLLLQIKHVMIIVAFVSLFLGLLVCFEKNLFLMTGQLVCDRFAIKSSI